MTVLFWILAALLTAGTLVMLVRPLLATSRPAEPEGAERALALYRQQGAELSQDVQAGVLGEEEYRQACRELDHRYRQEAGAADAAPAPRSRRSRWVTVGTVVLGVPLAGALLYAKLGNPLALTHPPEPETGMASGVHRLAGGLDELAEGLKRKLERDPGHGPGWALLARSYVELGRHAEAVPAFERAVALIPDDAQLLADYADALGVTNGLSLEGKPARLIELALALEPDNPKALLLAATVAVRREDHRRAVGYWERVLAGTPPGSTLAAEVRANIAEVRARPTGAQQPRWRAAGPAAAADRAISGTVRLAPGLDGRTAPTDTVFVFARAEAGPPMPVAVLRATVADLPLSFRLDDSHSVMPGRRLSQAGTVVVAARVSKSGTATPSAGDLQGASGPVPVGREGVEIVIDREVR